MVQNLVAGLVVVALIIMGVLAYAQKHEGCVHGRSLQTFKPCGSANNLQQSWRFDWEPPKAVLRDVRTIDWILGQLRSSAQADPVADRPILDF